MTHAWLDVTAGVAGDMLLGACVDAGADLPEIEHVVRRIVGHDVRLRRETVTRAGQRATRVIVELARRGAHHRTWRSIRAELEAADVPERTRELALAAFAALAEAEGRVHGVDPEDIHFHEAGALDSIADVVGTCEGLRQLGVETVSASPVAVGDGRIRAAHGDIPVPVPAVAQLAIGWQVLGVPGARTPAPAPHAHGDDDAARETHTHGAPPHGHALETHGDDNALPVHAVGPHTHDAAGETHTHEGPAVVTTPGRVGELATPTGMALLRSLASACEPLPPMTLSAVGVGAGGKDFSTHPNVVRLLLGERLGALGTAAAVGGRSGSGVATVASLAAAAPPAGGAGRFVELRANVDDMDPRLWPGVLDVLLGAGAADAWLTPILMKKGRPAHCLQALAPVDRVPAVTDAMLRHTTTLGVRSTPVDRSVLDRTFVTLQVGGHPVKVKVGHRDGVVLHAAAEFESVRELAHHLGTSELDALTRTAGAIAESGLAAGAELAGHAAGSLLTAPGAHAHPDVLGAHAHAHLADPDVVGLDVVVPPPHSAPDGDREAR